MKTFMYQLDDFSRSARSLALLVLGFVVGCGDDEGGPKLITIETVHPPALIAFRDEASAEWQALAIDGASTFEVVATGPYQVAVACEVRGAWPAVRIAQYARTPEDEASIHHRCRSAPPYDLRGQMVQPGMVFFGNTGQGTTRSSWDFSLPVSPGSFDLVMLSGDLNVGPDQIAIRRDVAIAGDTDLGTIDISQEGPEALVQTLFTASNLRPGESLLSDVLLMTGSTNASLLFGGAGPAARLAPETVLRATDRQRVTVYAEEAADDASPQRHYRGLSRDFRAGEPTSVALPEPLGPVAFEMSPQHLAATWSALPAHDEVSLGRWSYSTELGSRVHWMTLSRTFLEATGATSATLDLRDLPGFKPEWHHDPSSDQVRYLTATRGSTERASSEVSEWIDPTAPAFARRARAAMRPSLGGALDLAEGISIR